MLSNTILSSAISGLHNDLMWYNYLLSTNKDPNVDDFY